jgi:hypothetical protein
MGFEDRISMLTDVVSIVANYLGLGSWDRAYGSPVVWVSEDQNLFLISMVYYQKATTPYLNLFWRK